MARCSLLAVLACAACANNPGAPRFRQTQPVALTAIAPPRPTETVSIAMRPLPWWTVTGTAREFVLALEDQPTAPLPGRRIGAVRSRDIALGEPLFVAIRCAWMMIPWGEARPCGAGSRSAAIEAARVPIDEALAELRAKAGDAGADGVGDVRCFARQATRGDARLWCEGVAHAGAATASWDAMPVRGPAPPGGDAMPVRGPAPPGGDAMPVRGPAPPGGDAMSVRGPAPAGGDAMSVRGPAPAGGDAMPVRGPAPPGGDAMSVRGAVPAGGDAMSTRGPAPAGGDASTLPETRFVFVVDGSVGMLGRQAVVASTLGVRYRPLELGFYIVDLARDQLAPRDDGLVGLGLTLLGRFALGRSRADAIAGVSAVAAAPNGSTNPDFDGLYHGFAGLAYQTPWRLGGQAQPFVQLRAGAAYGTAIGARTLPMLELHVGLSTPERR